VDWLEIEKCCVCPPQQEPMGEVAKKKFAFLYLFLNLKK
jgi:hypothetical protein